MTDGIDIGAGEAQEEQPTKPAKPDNLAKARAALAAKNAAKRAAAAHPAQRSAARSPSGPGNLSGQPGAVRGHTKEGRVIVVGRDGKPVSRTGQPNADQFAIPAELLEPDWSYQWVAETVLNEPQTAALIGFGENGWTPVPADRWPGRFMLPGTTGPIRRGGQMLVERPKHLTEEARREEIEAAHSQLRTNVEQFMPPDSVASRSGLQPTGRIRKGRAVSTARDGVPQPALEIADE